jgi:short-subunit dehydrogenase
MKLDCIKNKVFIITGSCQGIGKELAKQVLLNGGKVVFNSRNKERKVAIQYLMDEHPKNSLFLVADVTNENESKLLVEKTIEHFGQIDVLVNNAGMSAFGTLKDTSLKVVSEIISSNLNGPINVTHFAIPHLIKTKGKILFISSLAGFHGLPNYSLYSCSKMALTALYQSLKKELLYDGVFVGIAYVGFTQNDIEKKTFSPNGELEEVPHRNRFKVASKKNTATLILNQISNGKEVRVHSFIGKMAFRISRYAPFVMNYMLLRNYRKIANNS